jgi:outer membrane autotransporter protein
MSITFKKLLLTGTAIVAVAYSVQAHAATVTVNTTGNFAVAADPSAAPDITYTADGTATVADGVDLTGTGVTTNANNQGTLTFSGDTGVLGAVGATGKALKVINAGATNKLVTFVSTVNAQAINFTGAGGLYFKGDVTTGGLVYGAGGTILLGDGITFVGPITTATNNTGILNLQGNAIAVNNVGAAGKSLQVINLAANASNSAFYGTVTAGTISALGTGHVTFYGNITGDADFAGLGARFDLLTGATISGNVDSTVASAGNLVLAGGVQTLAGNIGATHALTQVDGGANGAVTTFNGTVAAKSLSLIGTGTININNGLTGGVYFAGNDGLVVLAAGKNITGVVDNSVANSLGTLTLSGGTQTVGGAIGSTKSLKVLNAGATGGVSTLSSAVTADTINVTGTGTVAFGGAVTASSGILFGGNDGVVSIATGNNVTAAVDTSTANTGTLTLSGTTTVSGIVGGTKALKVVNAGAAGKTGTFTSAVTAQTINVTGTGNVAFNGDVTGAVVYGADGTVTLADAKNLTGAVTTATDSTGTLTLAGSSNLYNAVGAAGKALKAINVGANGSGVSFYNTVTATTITAIGDGTTFFYNGIVGNVDFAGNNADFALGSDTTVAGTVDSTGSAGGNLYLLGGVQTLAGTVGATKALTSVGAGADSAAVSTFSSIVNSGSLEFEGAGKINLNGVGANKIGLVNFLGNAGTLAVGAGVDLTGNIDDTTGTSMGTVTFAGNSTIGGTIGATGLLKALTLNGTGTTVSVGGNTKAADTTTIGGNTLAVTGTFTAAAAQTLAFDITGAATNGKITTTGNVVTNANTVVALTLNTGGAYIANNQQFTLIDDTNNNAGGGVGTLAAGKLTGSTALLTFTQVADTSDLIIKATRVGISTLATTENGQNVGVVLDSAAVTGSADPTLVLVEGNLANAGSTGALGTLLDSLTPRVDDGAYTAAFEVVLQVQDINDTRIASLRSGETGMAAGSSSADTGLWFQAYGQSATQDMRSSIAGYDSSTIGGAMGVDTARLLDHGIVGLAFNYGRTTVDSNNANTTSTDVDSYGLNLYGSREIMSQAFVTGQVGYAYNSINSERHNVGGTGLTAAADYSSDQYSAKVAVGRDYAVQSGMTLTPSVSAAYTYLDTASFTESGAGGANLSVNSDSMNRLDLGVGVVAGWKLKVANDGAVLKPTLHVGYAYDALGDRVQTTSNFTGAGASFATQGFEPARSRGDIGAGLSLVTAQNWDLSANYDYEVKSDYDAHSGYVRATTHF